jgi:hypothetical protein
MARFMAGPMTGARDISPQACAQAALETARQAAYNN